MIRLMISGGRSRSISFVGGATGARGPEAVVWWDIDQINDILMSRVRDSLISWSTEGNLQTVIT